MGYMQKNYFIQRRDEVHAGVEAKKSSPKLLAREKREMIERKSSAELRFHTEPVTGKTSLDKTKKTEY